MSDVVSNAAKALDYNSIDCESLNEFWDLLSPIGKTFGSANAKFIYRGQGTSNWQLVPRVYRADVIERYKRSMMSTLRDHPGQVFFEFALLNDFIHYCDFAGLPIPQDSMEFREYFSADNVMRIHSINSDKWPQDNVVPLMALAQHHGLPTRLLDWTSNPYVAAYFAGASAIERVPTNEERLAVFAIDTKTFYRCGLRHLRVPGSISENVSAQGGSFVLVPNGGYRGEAFTPDVSLELRLAATDLELFKVTLPVVLAGDLLLRCNKFGISAASVFPGYDGAAQAVLDWYRAFHFKEISEGKQ